MSVLAADNLVVGRDDARTCILDGVSFRAEPGRLVGLIGPNGAGKSTLLRCLAGLAAPEAGTVTLDGRPLAALPAAERGRRIGYLPQSFHPAWDYTVRAVVELGASRAPGAALRVPAALEANGLADLAERPWSRLSGGERARALLAAVLVAEPPVLLADEPGASLDVGHRVDLLRRLTLYARTRTVIVVLHDLERAVRDCDRLVLLDRGRIVLDGTANAVALSPVLDATFGIAFHRVSTRASDVSTLSLRSGSS
ncbi:ABC transporter ATP-binding protein [Methylobacterium sp. J-090]|uniref:ABC transporter ATP-binding protein n=1 Tax=Methylobacterium sp. J-090 TaxID=2836666 RepID=UPI001FBABF9B|nr:ABC transporter ATP-binding protein [Methylobacterium sp. J-090]MCJ2082660.1 ABC transporter ATP-binding protein [Methylobacterium sp. J-090]